MPERPAGSGSATVEGSHWTFLTSHAHVLLCVAADPGMRVRDIAEAVGITERAALRVLHDLVEAGYVTSERIGRRNRYRLQPEVPMRHPMERATPVGVLIDGLGEAGFRRAR
ncbi:MAG TPA: helix-turn-helix domain-containing protein [Candidatus Limnocylindrales bacterium]